MNWLPIESAPKDAQVFLWCKEEGVAVGQFNFRSKIEAFGDLWIMGDDGYCSPTHWLPIPELPA